MCSGSRNLALPVMAVSAALHVRTLKRPLPAAFCFAAFFLPAATEALPAGQESASEDYITQTRPSARVRTYGECKHLPCFANAEI